MIRYCSLFFFFQAEDGIRDRDVTGVQTCALPIYPWQVVVPGALAYLYTKGANADQGSLSQQFTQKAVAAAALFERRKAQFHQHRPEIGRASCRERAQSSVRGGCGRIGA